MTDDPRRPVESSPHPVEDIPFDPPPPEPDPRDEIARMPPPEDGDPEKGQHLYWVLLAAAVMLLAWYFSA